MKIKHTKQIIIFLILFLTVIVASVLIFVNKEKYINNADEAPSSASLSFSGGGAKTVGDTFNLSAVLNTGGNQICIVDFTITYPADLLELKSSSLGTPFSMTTEQSSSDGSIHYMLGGANCPSANATILTMSFNAKKVGSATVAFSVGDLIGGALADQVIGVSKGSTTVNIATKTVKKTTLNKNTNVAPVATVTIKDPTLAKVEYSSDAILDRVQDKAKGIVFSGTADPDVKINIVVASDPILASTQSDASGNWTYTLADWLSAGVHSIALISEKNTLKSAEVKTDFVIGTKSKDQIAIGTILPIGSDEVVPEPATNTSKSKIGFTTIAIIIGGAIGLMAIVLLIIFISKRRHYMKVSKEITGSIQANSTSRQTVENVMPIAADSQINQSQTEEPQRTDVFAPKSISNETDSRPIQLPDAEVLSPVPLVEPATPVESVPPSQAVPPIEPVPQIRVVPPPEPVPNAVENANVNTGEMVVGYGPASQVAPINQVTPINQIAKSTEIKEPTVVPENITNQQSLPPKGAIASPEPEITFDDEYYEEDSASK